MKYGFKPNAVNLRGMDAQACGREIESIGKTGQITPERIVARAKPKKSPLHDAFTWNDSEAAHKQRLLEAGYLIRALVTITDCDNTPVRACVTVTPKEEGEPNDARRVYMFTEEALKDSDYREQVLNGALRDFLALREKYRELKELARIFSAVDAVVKRHAA